MYRLEGWIGLFVVVVEHAVKLERIGIVVAVGLIAIDLEEVGFELWELVC